jgi:hypothetical protein
LEWKADTDKEDYIYDKFVPKDTPYAFVHDTCSDGTRSELPSIEFPIVRCSDFSKDHNIYDWWKVIANAEEIYVTESSIWAFCDGILDDITENRYIIDRDMRGCNTVSSHWRRLTSE